MVVTDLTSSSTFYQLYLSNRNRTEAFGKVAWGCPSSTRLGLTTHWISVITICSANRHPLFFCLSPLVATTLGVREVPKDHRHQRLQLFHLRALVLPLPLHRQACLFKNLFICAARLWKRLSWRVTSKPLWCCRSMLMSWNGLRSTVCLHILFYVSQTCIDLLAGRLTSLRFLH